MLSAELDGPFYRSLEDKNTERNVDGGFREQRVYRELTRGHKCIFAKNLFLFCHVLRT